MQRSLSRRDKGSHNRQKLTKEGIATSSTIHLLFISKVFNEMLTQQLTIELPKEVFYQFARMAKMTHQSVESLAIQSISGNLPPTVENAPLEIQASLQAMQTFSIEELLKIAHSQASTTQQQRHLALLEHNQETDSMVFDERQELRELGQAADRLMLKKAYAWALLRWRGYRIPPLDELPLT